MPKTLLIVVALLAFVVDTASAQDARALLQAAAAAMGASNLKTVRYSGKQGWVGTFGQSFAPSRTTENWPRTDLVSYTRSIDYAARYSHQDLTRRQVPNPRGGGAPFQGEQRQVTVVHGTYAWNVDGTTVNAAPAAADVRQLEILMTPHGFLKAAMEAKDATAVSRIETIDDDYMARNVTAVSFTALGKYRVNGQINGDNLVDGVMTWIPNPVLGDTLYEARYTQYRDFGGVKFPTLLHYHQGNRFLDRGHDVLQVEVSDVQVNVDAGVISVPDAVQKATVPPVRAASEKVADGVWLIGGGSHNSVLVEFNDFVTVVEAPLNEERSLAVIAEVKRLLPTKPIRYVVNTHHHFDHSGGLRTYVAHGATVITHEGNRDFYERVAFSPWPRTLQPDMLSKFPRRTALTEPPVIDTVSASPGAGPGAWQGFVVRDGARTMELYPVQQLSHSGTMLIAYLPAAKLLINADLYSPPAQGASPAPPSPSMRTLHEHVQRLKLDVAQHLPIHGRVGTHQEFLAIVGAAGSR
jgi:glyoxylase-like metal-dependent hydrolase (beta-lactamase superfamily II)